MFGFFNIRKPVGPTSHDVVQQVRRRLAGDRRRCAFKVGHAGTLDPFAEGVLVVCVGNATRLVEFLHTQPKRYRAEFRLGAASTTDDVQGEITPTPGAAAPPEPLVRRTLGEFVGTIRQVPPAHSAVHVAGRRAYKLARTGVQVDLDPRCVEIYAVEMLEYVYPSLRVDISCGCGTYVRAIARDVGRALGVGGYCASLVRTAVGTFELAEAVTVEQLDPQSDLLDPLIALARMPRVAIDDAAVENLKLGRAIPGDAPGGEVAVTDAAGKLLAIARAAGKPGTLQPVKVFCAG